jgi:hypothetical protein
MKMPSVGSELILLVFVSQKTAFRTLSLCHLQYAYVQYKNYRFLPY